MRSAIPLALGSLLLAGQFCAGSSWQQYRTDLQGWRRKVQQRRAQIEQRGLDGVFGKEPLRTFRAGSVVGVYRVHRSNTSKALSGRGDLRVLGSPVVPTTDWTKRFRAAMEDKKNHDWGISYKCGFDPGVVVRVEDNKKVVDVLFCFHCTEISIDLPTERGLIKQSFIPGRPAFLLLIKELFPNDKAIQSLKNKSDRKDPRP